MDVVRERLHIMASLHPLSFHGMIIIHTCTMIHESICNSIMYACVYTVTSVTKWCVKIYVALFSNYMFSD